MIDYAIKMIEEIPYLKELGTTKVQTPAAKHLFQTRDANKISKEKAEVFQYFTLGLLRDYFYAKGQD